MILEMVGLRRNNNIYYILLNYFIKLVAPYLLERKDQIRNTYSMTDKLLFDIP